MLWGLNFNQLYAFLSIEKYIFVDTILFLNIVYKEYFEENLVVRGSKLTFECWGTWPDRGTWIMMGVIVTLLNETMDQ